MTIGILDMDILPPKPAATETPKPVTRILDMDSLPPKPEVVGEAVNTYGKQIAVEDMRYVNGKLSGLNLSDKKSKGGTFFDTGTKLMEGSEQVTVRERAQWEKLPLIADAVEQHKDTIKNERRQDTRVQLSAYRIDTDGYYVNTFTGEKFSITKKAYGQLVSEAPEVHHETGEAILCASNIDSWQKVASHYLLKNKLDKERTLRVQHSDKEIPTLFAIVGKDYPCFDSHHVLEAIASVVPKDSRCEITYDRKTTKTIIDVSLCNPHEIPEDTCVGTLHKVFMRIDTQDNGLSSVHNALGVIRVRCVNSTLVENAIKSSHRHYGSIEDLKRMVLGGLGSIEDLMSHYSEKWESANIHRLLNPNGRVIEDPREAFKLLVANGWLKAPSGGAKVTKEFLSQLLTAHTYEPGDTFAAYQRAATRCAHTNSWKSAFYQSDLEKQAGNLLYAKVYTPDTKRKEYSLPQSRWSNLTEKQNKDLS